MEDDIMITPNGGRTAIQDADSKPQETYTKPVRDGMISYIEREVDKFDYEGYEVVRRELFSKANCPAVTLKYGSVNFNVRAIRKLEECSHIQILINPEKKLMIAKPCEEDEKDSVQWSKIDKREKVVPRLIRGQYFTAQLYKDMNWDINSTIKMLGTLIKCKDEKIFVFDLANAEAYISVSAPNPDNPRRRERIPLVPQHWQGHYGQSYEESRVEIVKTFDGMPEGFVKITLPQIPSRKSTVDTTESNQNINEERKDGSI